MKDKIRLTKEQVAMLEKVFNYAFNFLEQMEQGDSIMFVDNGNGLEKFDTQKEYKQVEEFAVALNERFEIVQD